MSKKQKMQSIPPFESGMYPKEIGTRRAASVYKRDENKPFFILLDKIKETKKQRDAVKTRKAVAHWFVRDFRYKDNFGLSEAYARSSADNTPLVCFWVNCPEQREAHSDSPFKHYYRMLSLKKLHEKLKALNISLVTIDAPKRKDMVPLILKFLKKYRISHLYSNLEYEVDELRIAIELLEATVKEDIAFYPCHDCCVVQPGELKTKSLATQYAVFTPWYKSWVGYVNELRAKNKTLVYPTPHKVEKLLTLDEKPYFPEGEVDKERFHKYYKLTGEEGADEALKQYIMSPKIKNYDKKRDMLDDDTVSHLSVHISSGTISARTILEELFAANKLSKANNAETPGIAEWVRQVSWRDFYKHIMCNWPYICMHKPFHLELSDVKWEYDRHIFLSWCEGKTGFPIVDACMRSLNETGYMNNRGRLIVASFFAKDLLIDWRNGERYFMLHLVDGDFASNNGGWGFAASTGVDPQPYFRIFNPWTQSEKFDAEGNFIRRWVKELKEIKGKQIHDPYLYPEAAAIAEKNNYPKPIVDHKKCRERALERYRTAMAEGKILLEGDN